MNPRDRNGDEEFGRYAAAAEVADPAAAMELDGSAELLRLALNEVPPRQRAAVILRYRLQLSVPETAELLGCSEGTVKSQAARGLETLRAALTRLDAPYAAAKEIRQ